MKSFSKNIICSIMTQGIALVISFFGSVLLARTLGAEGRGIVTWIVSLSTVTAVFVQFGMTYVNRRFVAEDVKHASDLISMTIIICFAMWIIVFPIALFFGFANDIGKHNNIALIIGLIISPIMAISGCLNEMLVGLHKPQEFNRSSLIQKASNTIFIIIFVLSNFMQPIIAIIALFASFVLQMFVILWYLRNYLIFKFNNVKWLVSHTRFYMFSNFVANISFICSYAIIPIFIGTVYSLEDVGRYAVCVLLIDAIRTIPRMIGIYSLPTIIKLKDNSSRNELKSNVIIVTITIMCVISIILYLLSNWMIPFLFGKDFIKSIEVFRTMLFGLVFASIFVVSQAFIGAGNPSWRITFAPLALLTTTIILSLILIPRYGALGAAYVWVVAHISANLTLIERYIRKVTN